MRGGWGGGVGVSRGDKYKIHREVELPWFIAGALSLPLLAANSSS